MLWKVIHSLFFILFNTLINNSDNTWITNFKSMNTTSYYIAKSIQSLQYTEDTLESIRDIIRFQLHQENSLWFPYGQNTSIECIALYLFNNIRSDHCNQRYVFPVVHEINPNESNSIDHYIKNRFCRYMSQYNRDQLLSFTSHNTIFPPIIIVSFSHLHITIDTEFILNNSHMYQLTGIVYYGSNHFTSWFITSDVMWNHDGMINNGEPIRENNRISISQQTLWMFGNRQASIAVYKLVT
jgi:hypothetical protein